MSSDLAVLDASISVDDLVERDGVVWFPAREAGVQSPNAPTKRTRLAYTPERHETIIDFMRNGHFLTNACRAARVHPTTVRGWLRKGEPQMVVVGDDIIEAYPDNAYGRFKLDYDAAVAEAEGDAVKAIKTQFQDDWRAPAWFLERRNPRDWGKQEQVHVTVSEDEKVSQAKQELFSRLESIQKSVNAISGEGHGEIVDAEVVDDEDGG